MIRIFIGIDYREMIAAHVLMHSILARTSLPVSFVPVMPSAMPATFTRARDEKATNEFSDLRFMVPHLCDYKGWAIFMDCDMLVRTDISDLWGRRDPRYAVQVVKHQQRPIESYKYLGTQQTIYPKKNWSSLMLFNCEKCSALTPEYVSLASGLDLHQFKWLGSDAEIGALPEGWNYLVGHDPETVSKYAINNAHFTIGGPYFHEYTGVRFADEWHAERMAMEHCAQVTYPNKRRFRRGDV
jgi:lipopolysaccharide biosynthesis glycosyltransferase